jgi:putative transposase
MQTFFCEDDYQLYIDLLSEWCRRFEVEVWAYCLMPNHVHMIAVPETEGSLRSAIGEAHRRYTRMVNFREGWRGHLWQGRFASFPMDEKYLLSAVRYIELNPVRARLVEDPCDWRWSSAEAHLKEEGDTLITISRLSKMISNWQEFLDSKDEQGGVRVSASP